MELWSKREFYNSQANSKHQIFINNWVEKSDGSETECPADTFYFPTPMNFPELGNLDLSQEESYNKSCVRSPQKEYTNKHSKNERKYSSSSSDRSSHHDQKKYRNNPKSSYEGPQMFEYLKPVKGQTRKNPHEDFGEEKKYVKEVHKKHHKKHRERKHSQALISSSDYENSSQEDVRMNHAKRNSRHKKRHESDSSNSSRSGSNDYKKKKHHHKQKAKGLEYKVDMLLELMASGFLDKKHKKPKKPPQAELFPGIISFPAQNEKKRYEDYEEVKINNHQEELPEDNRKLNIGQFQTVVCLIVGETGSGKSTFINSITNFFRDGTLKNKKIAIPNQFYPQTEHDFNQSENGQNQKASLTNDCNRYDFEDAMSASQFTFIDTPGLSDTRGVEQDDKNIKKIIQEIKNYEEINAIIVVQNGGAARITASLKNSIVRIINAIPKMAEDNIVLVLTNSPYTHNFDAGALQLKPQNTFLIDNACYNIRFEDIRKSELAGFQINWDLSMKKIKEIAEFVCKMGKFNAKCFLMMNEKVDKAKQVLHEAKTRLFNLFELKAELDEIIMQKESKLKNAKDCENYTQTKEISQTDWQDVSYHNTVCGNDDSLCHDHCGLEFQPTKNTQHFTQCACMGSDLKCTKCKCGPDSHYHTKRIPVKTTKKVTEVLQDLKNKYDGLNSEANKLSNKEEELENNIKNVEKSIRQAKDRIKEAIKKIKEVAPRYNISEEIDCYIKIEEAHLKEETDPKKRAKIYSSIRALQDIYQSLIL
ncbi:unnamed protein product [Blepharisma stoltei]|uniref:G domain-containing protein n=1 Tax=Blepharisma stoltei TaxID=1481888 RepID=A0AAU9I5K2_9CILI|nr:unnamed protein product [Blepharisma stoltei]